MENNKVSIEISPTMLDALLWCVGAVVEGLTGTDLDPQKAMEMSEDELTPDAEMLLFLAAAAMLDEARIESKEPVEEVFKKIRPENFEFPSNGSFSQRNGLAPT